MSYYSESLSGERLRRCYEVATPRVRRYLEAEIEHLTGRVRPGDRALELGCGYGRVLEPLRGRCRLLAGIDTARAGLLLARTEPESLGAVHLIQTDATSAGLRDGLFDLVFCVQNGIAAFNVDARALVSEAIRITRPGGRVLFSSYAPAFWPHRLEWFRIQAAHDLVGRIDEKATGDGIIVCEDGFRAGAFDTAAFESLAAGLRIPARITEVDESSLFCELEAPQGPPPSRSR